MEKNQAIKGILFDLDGTLIDTAPDFILSLNNILTKHNHAELDSSIIRSHVSDGSGKLISLGFGINEEDLNFNALRSEFLLEYEKNLLVNSNLFDGITSCLQFLETKGIKYGIVTNKPRRYAEPLIQYFEALNGSEVLICSDDLPAGKPNPIGIETALKKLNISNSECIYIGDHLVDLQAGKGAGTEIIACYFGYSLLKENNPYDCNAVDSPYELNELFKRIL